MTENTINNDMTMGGATGALLAGRYRVVRQLGQGGMGSVWLAEDTKLDGFKVAIKMLPSVLVNNKRAYAQVKAEALVSLKLSHPNIATVRAFEEESGSPFLVMDYIDGQTLDDYLAEKGKLTEYETIRLLKPVAAALDYAHTQGVVHRDVKPGNVMIRKDGTPFVLDFGIAREIQETMTRVTGKLSSGTLLYMSPEQLRGAMPAPAQDVYSFAAMAYECLTGNPPFARGQIEYQIEHVEPAPLGPQFIKCGPGVMAGLAKKPENRPASCVAVLTSSRGNDGGRSPRPTPEPRQESPRSSTRTTGGKGVVVGLIVALVLAGAGTYHYISANNAERRRMSEAQMTFERARTSLNEYERKIENLSREDGFGSRIDEISEKIPSRIALKDVSSFLSAAERCAGLEKGCRQLLTADELRIQAKTVRDAAQQARQKAQGQYASQDAKLTWQAAESAYEQGRREFSQFDFERAVQSFTLSGQHYEKAASEATSAREERQKAELARQEQKAKEEELRKKNEKEIGDLRAACLAAKKEAEDAEASEFASKEMSDALKLLADADNALDGDPKQTYQVASNAFERACQVAMEASKPRVTLKAMLNGEEVNATVISGLKDKTRKTPVTVDLSGWRIGSTCEFDLAYLCDGVRYVGVCRYFVKKGNGVAVVALMQAVDPPTLAVDVKKTGGVQLWENGPYWAECNVGGMKPEDPGYYFWWGDTVGYKRTDNRWNAVDGSRTGFFFSPENCTTYGMDTSRLQSLGYIDSTGSLVAKYDAATVHLGMPWRLPTSGDMNALIKNCDVALTKQGGVAGYLVRGRGTYSSNSIFLPAVGFGDGSKLDNFGSFGGYWSSALNFENPTWAFGLHFFCGHLGLSSNGRNCGQPVRPVSDLPTDSTVLDLKNVDMAGKFGKDRVSSGNVLSEEEKASGWKLLWDGKTSSGWVSAKDPSAFPVKGWSMKDGVLTVHPLTGISADGRWFPLPPEERKLGGGGDIATVKKYRNFEFKFEFKIPESGRTGVRYFYDERFNKRTCETYQIVDKDHPDCRKGKNGCRKIAALYDILPTQNDVPYVSGAWNRGMIVANGSRVEHWLNDVCVLRYDRGSDEFRKAVAESKYASWGTDGMRWGELAEGRIVLVDHTDARASFRNLKIREL